MTPVLRLSFSTGAAPVTISAVASGGKWSWSEKDDFSHRHVERVEVFRATENRPCLLLECDGSEDSRVDRKAGRVALELQLLSPAFYKSKVFAADEKGRFEFVADVAPAIFLQDGGDSLWTRFTSRTPGTAFPKPRALLDMAATGPFEVLGAQSISNNSLKAALPFSRSDADPSDKNVALFLRPATTRGSERRVFLVGFSPVFQYEASLDLNGIRAQSTATAAEWVQPAESLDGLAASVPNAWLLFLRGLEGGHQFWNAFVQRPYVRSLQTVAAGEDATFVPELQSAGRGTFAVALRMEFESRISVKVTNRSIRQIEPFVTSAEHTVALRLPGLPLLAQTGDLAYQGRVENVLLEEVLDQFAAWPDSTIPPGVTGGEATRLRIHVKDCKAAHGTTGVLRTRFGALDLGFAADGELLLDAEAQVDGVRLSPQTLPDLQVRQLTVRVHEMVVADVRPGAEDPVPDATRTPLDTNAHANKAELALRRLLASPTSLVIPLDADDQRAPALLEAQEQTGSTTSRSLIVRLRRHSSGVDKNRSVIYISREPLLIAKVGVPALVQPDTDSDEIANWSLSDQEGRKWEIAAASRGFALTLPPQAVGEAMEKSTAQPAIQDGKPIDYRLGAPAKFQLQSSWFPQGYAEPPWNLSRVLGYPGQRAPGARVDRVEVELVYGINTVVDAAQVPVRLSLAETASRTGAMAPPLERVLLDEQGYAPKDGRRQVFLAHRVRWAQTLTAFRSRLAVLELYEPGARAQRTDDQPFQTLGLQQGVTAFLRDGRYMKAEAGAAAPDTGADLRYPILPSRRAKAGAYYEGGLPGGFAWPFESDAIFRNLLRNPVSNEAHVSGLRFSALGAWGDQRASFDNKRTKIISTTVMGRLSKITVERVGRIGVLWNRSKHVIVYERTVLPFMQFEPSQLKLAGRAILRKVAEYVEILEPERRYPEFGAALQSRGFVEGVHFGTRRILVNGSWGEDGPNGFEIRLWDPQADQRIYPRPSVFLSTAGDKQGVADRVPREISEPDRLIFFSATAPELDDRTDLWPAFSGVDYDNLPAPQPEAQPPLHPGDADASLPNAVADMPGWRRFTWPLSDDALATNLVAERAKDNALNARLSNVSMMRSAAGGVAGPVPAAMAAVDATRALLSQLQQNAGAAARSGLSADELKARLLDMLGLAHDALAQVGPANSQGSDTLLHSLQASNPTNDAIKRVGQDLRQGIERQRTLSAARIDEWRKTVRDEIRAVGSPIPATEFKHMAETWASSLVVQLAPLKTGYDKFLTAADDLVLEARRQHMQVLEAFNELVWPLEDSELSLEDALDLLEQGRAATHGMLATVGAMLPTEVPPLLQGALAGVRLVLSQIQSAVDVVFDDVARELSQMGPWLPALWEQIGTLREQSLGDPDSEYVDGELTLATPIKLLDKARSELDGAIRGVLGVVPDFASELAKRLTDLGGGAIPDIEKALEDACTRSLNDLDAFAAGVLGRVADEAFLKPFVSGALGWAESLQDLSTKWLGSQGKLEDWKRQLEQQTVDQVAQWVRGFEPGLRDALSGVEGFYGRVRSVQEDLSKSPTFQDPTSTLRLIRAVGEGPLLPEMNFNRDRLAYFFDDYAAAVRSSPVAALVNRVGDDLKALGIRLPTESFLERVIPASLQNFDLSKILPDFSALKNNALFERLKMPAIANDTIKVTHGFDESNRVPWLKASVDVPFTERAEAFKLGPLSLILPKAQLTAKADVRVVGGTPQKTQDASIKADWLLEFGGLPLVTFADTVLQFDEGGRMRFDIKADRIRMDATLQWMTDLMKAYQPEGGSGLKLDMVYDGGRPVGVACTLAVALPPIGAGVFAVSGLMLGAGLTLAMDSESNEFAIGIQFNLSRKVVPFTLTIAFLNGGGWVETEARYLTTSRRVVSRVSIGIVAGAGVEFALGPCHGSVYVQFGIFVEFQSGASGGQTLSIGIMLLVRGSVVVFSIATVTITLLLQAVYREDGSLTGYGSLSVSIKVSQFFKLSFSSQVTYQLQGGSGKRQQSQLAAAAAPPPSPAMRAIAAADRHAQLFQ